MLTIRSSFLRDALGQRFRATAGGLPGAFWTLWWGLIVNRLASFVIAFLSIYLVRERGFSTAEAGRVLALYGAGMTISGPLGGLLADRIGRKATMVGALVLGAVSVTSLAFVRTPVLLSAFAFASAVSGEVFRPAMSAAVADVVPPGDRTRAFGLVYWAVNFALSVGLFLGGLLAGRSITALFLADAGSSLVAAGILLVRVPETRPAGVVHEPALRGLAKVFADGPYMSFLGLHLLALTVFTQWQLGLPIDMTAHGFAPSAYAFLMALNCAGVVLLQPILSPRLAHFDAARLLATSALLFGAGFGVNSLGGSLGIYALGTSLWTIGEVVGFPVASTMAANLAPPSLRGRYQGAFSMCWGVAFTISPLAAGEAMQRFGARTLWVLCFAIAVLVSIGHLATAGARRRRLVAVLHPHPEPILPAPDLEPLLTPGTADTPGS